MLFRGQYIGNRLCHDIGNTLWHISTKDKEVLICRGKP